MFALPNNGDVASPGDHKNGVLLSPMKPNTSPASEESSSNPAILSTITSPTAEPQLTTELAGPSPTVSDQVQSPTGTKLPQVASGGGDDERTSKFSFKSHGAPPKLKALERPTKPLGDNERILILQSGLLPEDIGAYDALAYSDATIRAAYADDYTAHTILGNRDQILDYHESRRYLKVSEILEGMELDDPDREFVDREIVTVQSIEKALVEVLGVPSFKLEDETYHDLGTAGKTEEEMAAQQDLIDSARPDVLRLVVGGLNMLEALLHPAPAEPNVSINEEVAG
jgi:hypothetical protein